jgi:hypothetical protein
MVFKIKWQTEVIKQLEYYLTSGSKLADVFQFPLHLKHPFVSTNNNDDKIRGHRHEN